MRASRRWCPADGGRFAWRFRLWIRASRSYVVLSAAKDLSAARVGIADVILSAAKDLSACRVGILRFAQDDNVCSPHSVLLACLHLPAREYCAGDAPST